MKVTWLGHSCFKVEKDGFSVILDPYQDGSVPGLKNVREQANLVLCSHEHGDHNGRECVTLVSGVENPFTVSQITTYHDDANGKLRGNNQITILDDGSERLVHLGDLGCALDEEQICKLQGADVLLVPVGGFYTIDARQAVEIVEQLQPKKVIPMHYRNDESSFGFDVIETVDVFTNLLERVAVLPGSTVESGEEYGARILVLQPGNAANT